VTERRLRRRAAQQRFDELAVDYLDLPGVSRATMFGSNGLRVEARFFAFVGRDGQLIVAARGARPRALWQRARPTRYALDVAPCASGSERQGSLTTTAATGGEI